MMLTFEDRNRRDHPRDGLVCLLFSRLAAMLAIEQAEEIGKRRQFTPTEISVVESSILKRAAAQESCRLSWNRDRRLYELRHPSLSKRHPPPLVGAAGIPLSPVQSQSSGVLHITVSATSRDVSQAPTIIVTEPISPKATEAGQQAADPRTSTLPVADSDEPLAALDFGSKTLSISPAAVIATIPSLYAIDTLIAAILAVAVSDETTNPILADMSLGSPTSSVQNTTQRPAAAVMPFRGEIITTIAERNDSNENLDPASSKAKSKTTKQNTLFRFWNRFQSTSARTSTKNQQIVVEEFDLEKYGRYGTGSSREGEKLPSITRSILRVLFWALDMLVWGLTLVVKVLAWLLVNSTRCVTSEKF